MIKMKTYYDHSKSKREVYFIDLTLAMHKFSSDGQHCISDIPLFFVMFTFYEPGNLASV